MKLIANLQVTNENFKTALDILKNGHENKTEVLNTLLCSILDIKPIQTGSGHQLREFHTFITHNWKALINFNLTPQQMFELERD